MRKHLRIGRLILLSALIIFFSQHIALARNPQDLRPDIYSKIKCCPCKLSFEKCSCKEAKEMRVYIDALIDAGVEKEEIYYKVAKKYTINTIIDKQVKAQVEARLIKESGEKRPQIILQPDYFGMGILSKKQGKVSRVFKLSNKGNSQLIITSIKTTCPCASVSLTAAKTKGLSFSTEGSPKDWSAGIGPGQSADLELVVDLASPHVKIGKLIREALIFSNDPIYPQVNVRVEGEVKD